MKRTFALLLLTSLAVGLLTTGCSSPRNKKVGILNFPSNNAPAVPPVDLAGGDKNGKKSTTDVQPPVDSTAKAKSENLPPGAGMTAGNQDLPSPEGLDGMVKDVAALKAHTIYFDFDRAAVRSGEQNKAEAVAKFLKEQAQTKVQIEGHCDERGTEEYNRGLGERRALAIREYLLTLGIDGKRVFTITYGKDRPAVREHNEDAWAKNRRGEFILYRPKT